MFLYRVPKVVVTFFSQNICQLLRELFSLSLDIPGQINPLQVRFQVITIFWGPVSRGPDELIPGSRVILNPCWTSNGLYFFFHQQLMLPLWRSAKPRGSKPRLPVGVSQTQRYGYVPRSQFNSVRGKVRNRVGRPLQKYAKLLYQYNQQNTKGMILITIKGSSASFAGMLQRSCLPSFLLLRLFTYIPLT